MMNRGQFGAPASVAIIRAFIISAISIRIIAISG